MREIDADKVQELVEEGAVLLDCRSKESYEQEHIDGAIVMPWRAIGELAEKVLPDTDVPIITSCSSTTCDASVKCYAALEEAGYTNLYEYPGGLADWKAQGLPTVAAPQQAVAE